MVEGASGREHDEVVAVELVPRLGAVDVGEGDDQRRLEDAHRTRRIVAAHPHAVALVEVDGLGLEVLPARPAGEPPQVA